MKDSIRIAHLSDPHLPGPAPRGAEWLGKRGLSALSWRARRDDWYDPRVAETLLQDLLAAEPDAIAVAGDVVNFSLGREFAAAAGWLAALGPPRRVVVTPGNHEALVRGWQRHMRAWGAYASGAESWTGLPFVRTVGEVDLIALSTAVATPPLLACGRVGEPGRARLAELVRRARQAGRLPVVLMHHPPSAIVGWRKGLLDGRAVGRVLASAGAALVLHGHTHRSGLSWIDAGTHRIPVLGVASFAAPPGRGPAPGAWQLVELTRGDRAWTATVTERAITAEGVRPGEPRRMTLPGPTACGARRGG